MLKYCIHFYGSLFGWSSIFFVAYVFVLILKSKCISMSSGTVGDNNLLERFKEINKLLAIASHLVKIERLRKKGFDYIL